MAMNQPPLTDLSGAVLIPRRSRFKCPSCGDIPPLADTMQNGQAPPSGTPASLIATPEPTNPTVVPTMHCFPCWQKFYYKFICRHAPQLVPIMDEADALLRGNGEVDPAEEGL